jgi:hypothetical protein
MVVWCGKCRSSAGLRSMRLCCRCGEAFLELLCLGVSGHGSLQDLWESGEAVVQMGWEFAGFSMARMQVGQGKATTEPSGRGGVGLVLRPSHKFSKIPGIFHMGIILHKFLHTSNSTHGYPQPTVP